MSAPSYRDLVGSYLDLRWQLDPVEATQAGVRAHDGRLGDFTRPQVKVALAALKAMASAFEYCETDSLADEVDQTAVLNDLRTTINRFEKEKPHETSAEFHLSHLLGGLFNLLLRQDAPADARARALTSRLEATPRFLRDAQATLKRPAKVFTETALAIARGGRALFAEAVPEFAASLAPEPKGALLGALGEARTALDEFVEFTGGELLDRSDDAFAVGAKQFDFRLHYEHALRETAPELLRFGEGLVRAQQEELARRAEQLAPGVPWRELVRRLRKSFPARATLVSEYRAAMERARRFVSERDLATIPEGPLEIVATPPFMQPLIPFAAYEPPAAFAPGRTGWFYVSVPEEAQLREHSVHELATTALHEGYPGHHVQFLAAQAQASPVRRIVGSALSLEGWALYCEQMMGEEGFYTRPEEAFFQQMHLLWRAVRVVLDVRLQTTGMTVEQAVQYMTDTLDLARPSAEAEVRRFCCNPANALCYAVGRHELLRLREDWRRRAGPAAPLKRFHDEVLSYGGLPVSLMRWGMGLGESER